jgi:3-oxoacyl-[acyl-carrier-protein] synthase II
MTGLGTNLQSSWKGLLEGRCPAKEFTIFDPTGLPTTFGVELPASATEIFESSIKKRRRSQMTRGTMIAVVTARSAIEDSGLNADNFDAGRAGVIVGGTGTGYAPRAPEIDRHRILKNMASAPASWISLTEKLAGPAFVVSTACSSGAYALHCAFLSIMSGECDVVVSGAADSAVNYLDVEGFCSLLALADAQDNFHRVSRPFDKNRSGFVLAEGGGMLVLESMEHARGRGAKIYAEMSLPGLNSEAYNIISPRPDGSSIAYSMEKALANAGLKATDIDYINAHGTSTVLNDLTETNAIKSVFGKHAHRVAISSTKSTSGHCLSAAAGVESVICCQAINQGVIPPTANLDTPDPELDLDYVPLAPRKKQLKHVMSNSFGFGGHNGVCVFSAPGSSTTEQP